MSLAASNPEILEVLAFCQECSLEWRRFEPSKKTRKKGRVRPDLFVRLSVDAVA